MRNVLLLPADQSGCGLYRMLLPGRQAADSPRGFSMTTAGGLNGRVELDENDRPFVASLPPIDFDVMVFQRPFDSVVRQCIPIAQAQGVAVVVELDDDVRNIDPRNSAWPQVQPKYNQRENWQNILDACRMADWVTVSTPELKWYAPHGRVSVVPNAVPRSLTQHSRPVRMPGSICTVGWTGAMATHPGDLEETFGQVGRAVTETFSNFHIVGDGTGVKEALRLEIDPTSTGWLPLPEYPAALAQIDVGIVPLGDTKFNRSKSYLKGLEFAGLGIPFVASPLPEYIKLSEQYGIGEIARRPGDWYKKITRLVTDIDYRNATGQLYRERVAAGFLVEHTVDAWMDAWESAYAHRNSLVLTHA